LKTGIIPDSNRSTSINFVHVNGRSLYIVDWRTVVVVEDSKWPIPCKREGNCPGGGNVRGGICPGGTCSREMSTSR